MTFHRVACDISQSYILHFTEVHVTKPLAIDGVQDLVCYMYVCVYIHV